MTLIQRLRAWHTHLPEWVQEWLGVAVPLLQIVLIVLGAWLLNRTLQRILRRVSTHYQFPHELLVPISVVLRWLIISSAVLLALERLGVSATVLWSAFTGFATVGAVAFFAAWSVLSNLFCAFLILTSRPFTVGDYIEVLDNAEKPGALGKVVDINLLYTTLEDLTETNAGALVQIPNALIFQRVVRRWRAGSSVPQGKLQAPPPAAGSAGAAAPTVSGSLPGGGRQEPVTPPAV